MKAIKLSLLVLAALTGAAALAQFPPQVQALLVPYASDADAVTLPDGRKLAFTCMGAGSPTVILTPGLGDIAGMAWANVQPEMAKTTRVCAWDRPGFGLSDGSVQPQTVATTTADLAAALGTGKIPGPYVMVGHSLGGYESLLFADRRKDQVVGMVLVDPSVPDQQAISDRILGPAADPAANVMVQVYRKCAADIREGTARLGGPDPGNCFAYPPMFPPELSQALGQKVSNPIQYETMASFIMSFREDSAIVVNPDRNYGDMPLRVLSAAAQPPPSPGMSADRVAASAALQEEGDRARKALAALSSRGVHVRVEGANHYIQRTQPQAVIDAVAAVVAEARAAAR
jgi:pimeloyl-ACP methyl ester carboxylesterase